MSRDEYDSVLSVEKIDWNKLSGNICAVKFIEEKLKSVPDYPDIDWAALSANPSAIYLLKKYQDKIVWKSLSANSSIFGIDRGSNKSSSPNPASYKYKYEAPKYYL